MHGGHTGRPWHENGRWRRNLRELQFPPPLSVSDVTAALGLRPSAFGKLAEQLLEERERIARFTPLDAAQDFLIGLGGGGVALRVLRRRHVGDAALVAGEDRVDALIETVDVVAHDELAAIVDVSR